MAAGLLAELIVRIALAGVCGILTGINRELHAKEAGIRVHFIVGVGSSLLMVISKYGFLDMTAFGIPAGASMIAAQVVNGIGFLGGGIILVNKRSVQGLTTAAGLWTTAAIGLAIGAGMYIVGGAAQVLTLLGYGLNKYAARLNLMPSKLKTLHIDLKVEETFNIEEFMALFHQNHYRILNHSFKVERQGGDVLVKLTLSAIHSSKDSSKGMVEELKSRYVVAGFNIAE